MQPIKDQLKKLNACSQAIEWVGDQTLENAWNTCPRGDWMLWLYRRSSNYDFQLLTLAKGHCANTVRHLMKDKRSTDAIDMAIKFGEGVATRDELNAAYAAAADAAAAAAAAAAYAADAAAAAYAADADAAAAAYAAAAYAAAAYAAAYAAAARQTARKANQQATADICRKYLPLPIL
jgi:hypothetical protein